MKAVCPGTNLAGADGLESQLVLHERQQVWADGVQMAGDPLAICFGQSQGDCVDKVTQQHERKQSV